MEIGDRGDLVTGLVHGAAWLIISMVITEYRVWTRRHGGRTLLSVPAAREREGGSLRWSILAPGLAGLSLLIMVALFDLAQAVGFVVSIPLLVGYERLRVNPLRLPPNAAIFRERGVWGPDDRHLAWADINRWEWTEADRWDVLTLIDAEAVGWSDPRLRLERGHRDEIEKILRERAHWVPLPIEGELAVPQSASGR